MKNVEFGAMCNYILVDGILFIEKLSFNAFSEGTRLEHCIKMHKRLFKVDVKSQHWNAAIPAKETGRMAQRETWLISNHS